MDSARLVVQPLELTFSLKEKVYQALKDGILAMNIYASPTEIRLDERQLADDLGVLLGDDPVQDLDHVVRVAADGGDGRQLVLLPAVARLDDDLGHAPLVIVLV